MTMIHVGWLDRSTGSMRRVKTDSRPEPWWVPLYVEEAELDVADDAIAVTDWSSRADT